VLKRSWVEISADILEVTLTPSNKTRIMYRSNLNFERFNRYFYGLVTKGFIDERNDSNGRRVYKTTERGRTLLKAIRKAQELFSSEE
jgi:predicted transcriptional regulator